MQHINPRRSSQIASIQLLTSDQVAAILGVSRGHLANLRYEGRGLRYVKVGRAVRYYAEDVATYVAANTVEPSVVAA